MKIRPEITSSVFANLASGWYGLIFITPLVWIYPTIEGTILSVVKEVIQRTTCLYISEYFARRADDKR